MRTVSLIMALVMLVMVLAFASLFTFTPFMELEMQGTKRNSFTVLLWLYGAYRSYRLYMLQKNTNNNAT